MGSVMRYEIEALLVNASTYRHFAGFGKPAILVACFAGPLGKSLCKYMLLPLSAPKLFPIALTNARIAGEVLYSR